MDSLEALRQRLGQALGEPEKSPKGRIYFRLPASRLNEAVRFLFDGYQARLATATGRDTRAGIEVIYHLFIAAEGRFLNPVLLAPKPEPVLPSLAGWLPAASWIEREMHDLLGVDFAGHPQLTTLLRGEDWPEGAYPLRRGFGGFEE